MATRPSRVTAVQMTASSARRMKMLPVVYARMRPPSGTVTGAAILEDRVVEEGACVVTKAEGALKADCVPMRLRWGGSQREWV